MSEANKALNGSFLLVLAKLSEKMIGLISTLVLARVLVPDDFGIVAIANLIIVFSGLLAESGGGLYLIQKKDVDDIDINTSWTIDLILKLGIFAIIFLASPIITEYYGDSRLLSLIPVLGLLILLSAATNPYLNILRRQQQYGVIFKIELTRKVISVIIVIIVSLIFKSYWALVVGQLTSNTLKVLLSYIFVTYRPRLCLKKAREQWKFSKWMLYKGVLGFSREQLDTFIVSSTANTSQLGGYYISKYVSTIPGYDGVAPALDPLLATYSRTKTNSENLKYQVKLTLFIICLTVLPLSSFVFFNSDSLVALILGNKWADFSFIFGVLSLTTVSLAFGRVASQLLTSSGKVKILFYYDLISLLTMAIVLFSLASYSLDIFAVGKVVTDFTLVALLFFYSTFNLFKLSILKLLLVFIWFSILSVLTGYLSNYCFSFQIPVFFTLIINFIVAVFLWILYCLISYKLFFQNDKCAHHLIFIVKNYLNKVRLTKKTSK